ncbi:MAG: MBL fold metallo-hydrolase [Patescibacteria group bacterium]|nr:MBL fold metallo-hydrolase [Patescibacteria group bacterium]
MVIQRIGGYGFKISAGATTVAVNPPSQRSKKFKVSKFGADVVLVSVPHSDWNGVETATHGEKEPFVIQGPGAYEVGDVTVTGYATRGEYDDVLSDVGNTIYIVEMDGIRVLVLGALAEPKLPAEVRSELDTIGIILTPIGDGTLGPKEAHELVTSVEPKAVIPYAVGGEDDVKAFLKAEGETGVKPEEKFTVRAKELAAMDGAVVLLA